MVEKRTTSESRCGTSNSSPQQKAGFGYEHHACAPAPHVPVSNETSSANQPRDSQNAVYTTLDKLWEISHPRKLPMNAERADEGTVVLTYQFLGSEDDIANFNNLKNAVVKTIKEWEEHANVRFHPVDKDANIRIAFNRSKGCWSVVGRTDGITFMAPTLNLGMLSGMEEPSEEDQGVILHEFGHVLGMMHEHQSPARGEKITLKEKEVYEYYRPLLKWDDELVKTQVLDVYDTYNSNFSRYDKDSIMMYFMPSYLNNEGIRIEMNVKLSELDKAYVALIYPYNDLVKLSRAMSIIGIKDKDAIEITKPLTRDGDVKGSLDLVRRKFLAYNKDTVEAAALLRAKQKRA